MNIRAKMSKNAYTIKWLGFNEKKNFNRVWGHILMKDGRHYVFWGVRGHKIDFKKHSFNTKSKIPFIISQHEERGYTQIKPAHYEMICPKFIEDMEIWFMAHVLKEE